MKNRITGKADWEQTIMARLRGKDDNVEIRTTSGGFYVIIPPGREMDPDGDSDEVTIGWTFNVEGSDRFEQFSCLRELLDECLDEEWQEIRWPVALEVSVDNGTTMHTADSLPEEDLHKHWDALAERMDDDAREKTHQELAPTSRREFLRRYLDRAPADLII